MEEIKECIEILENTQKFTKNMTTGNLPHKRALVYANIELVLIKLREITEENGKR